MITFMLFAVITALVWIAWFVGWMLIDELIEYFNKKED